MNTIQNFAAKAWLAFSEGVRWATLLAAVVAVAAMEASAYGQDKAPAAKDAKKLPEPEDLMLQTNDGLQLAVTYYPGSKGKQSIPIILLHEFKQSRTNYKTLAPALQAFGYAVIVPDSRGHGESKSRKGAGRDEKLDAAKGMAPSQFGLMVVQDMKAVKDFLWEKNNAGELNIDKLCVVGAEMGASVALEFAAFDSIGYDNKAPFYGPLKLGRFLKMLVLISPKWSSPGLPISRAIANPVVKNDLSMLILVGKQDDKAMKEAKRIYDVFEKSHPEQTGDDKLDKQTLFMLLFDTSLQGTKMLDPGIRIEFFSKADGNKMISAEVTVQDLMDDFIVRRLVKSPESKEWNWKERKYPHE